MALGDLSSLLSALEYGTNIHISVVFLNQYGNQQTQLPFEQQIHKCAMCDAAKITMEGHASCIRCRQVVLKLLLRRRKGISGLCPKGIFEYCHPVIRGVDVAAAIFVGNILTEDSEQAKRLQKHFQSPPTETMEKQFPLDKCLQTAVLVENYIHFLMDHYGEVSETPANALIESIKSYLQEMYLYDFSMADIAAIFNYNEKYLGRLFKSKTGYTVKEYCNALKIGKAKEMLKGGNFTAAEVAVQSGFNNLTHFNRVFKKIVGQVPREYRKTNTQ